MKIFLSWSGPTSKAVAEALREWLPLVIQAVRPWMSSADIDKGARWNTSIAQELAASKVGLICLTPDNLTAPWLLFEAGALSKTLEDTFVCSYLFGLEPTDVTGPLVQFQLTRAQRDDTRSLIKTINRALDDGALPENTLNQSFDTWWPRLEERLKNISLDNSIVESKPQRSDSELLAEVLGLVREMTNAFYRLQRDVPASATARNFIMHGQAPMSLPEIAKTLTPRDRALLTKIFRNLYAKEEWSNVPPEIGWEILKLLAQTIELDKIDDDDDTPETPSS